MVEVACPRLALHYLLEVAQLSILLPIIRRGFLQAE
jgi:hypothetical protein